MDIRHGGERHSAMTPRLGVYRGLVLNTYMPEDSENRRGEVECDVLLIRTHNILQHVQVLQRGHGINEAHAPWIPRASTRTLDGSELRFSGVGNDGRFQGPATQFANSDGDMVAIQFVEGNVDYPIITGALSHERTNRVLKEGSGWSEGSDDRGTPQRDEYYIHHRGAEIRVNADGDTLIDTVGAYSDRSTEDNSSAGGQVRVRVKDTQRLTIAMGDDEDVLEIYKAGGQLRIDLGEGSDERVILGDSFMQFFNSHIHPTGVGPSDVPTLPMDATLLSEVSKTKK
jgi:hypothetical protein